MTQFFLLNVLDYGARLADQIKEEEKKLKKGFKNIEIRTIYIYIYIYIYGCVCVCVCVIILRDNAKM